MDRDIDLLRRLDNLIRLGTVHSVDLAEARVRLTIGGLTTSWLPWLTHRAGTTRHWSAPTVGEQVIVLSPGGDLAAGVALSGIYSDTAPAPSVNASEHLTVYPDGTRIAYDHSNATLTLDVPTITINGNVAINGASLTHNGKNVGATHTHSGVQPGTSNTGAPQ